MNAAAQIKRSPWPYAIAGYFLVAITGIATFISWAVTQNMELVRKDYYEHEILFQRQIDAASRAKALGAEVSVKMLPDMQKLSIKLPSTHVGSGFEGKAHFYRPNDSKLDHAVGLSPAAGGEQVLTTEGMASGIWRLRLEWKTSGVDYLLEQPVIITN